MEGHRNESGGECSGEKKKKECPSVSLETIYILGVGRKREAKNKWPER